MWVDVRHPSTNRLLFRYDPARDLVQIGERGAVVTVDLTAYQRGMVPVAAGLQAQLADPYPLERRRRGPIR